MDYRTLQQELRKRPFEPFRIALADGKIYDIYHPESILVGKQWFIFGVVMQGSGQGNGETAYDRYETVSMLHVVRLEPLPHSHTA
jgi:hypothetical protein